MKKHFLFAAALMAAMMAQATVLVDETFTDFPDGWTTSGSVTTGAGRTSDLTPLIYSNAGGTYALSGQGKSVKSQFDACDKYLQVKKIDSITTGTFYVSFLLRPDGTQKQSNAQVFGLSETNTAAALRVWMGKTSPEVTGKCRLGITRVEGSSSKIQWATESLDVDQAYLVVIKYNIEDSTASLFIDPKIDDVEPATPNAVEGANGVAKKSFNYMCFYSTGNTKTYYTLSGVRIATTWNEAVASGTPAPVEKPTYANSINANFSDSLTWTNTLAVAPASASFPTDTVGDWIFTSSAIVKNGRTWYLDQDSTLFVKFYARLHMDKNTYKASLETPWVANIDTLYLYGNAGSDSKNVKIEYRKANEKWAELTTFTNMKTPALFEIPVKKENVKLRISNATTSSQYFYYIGNTNPATLAQKKGEPTALPTLNADQKSVKMIENGQLIIINKGVKYNALGIAL